MTVGDDRFSVGDDRPEDRTAGRAARFGATVRAKVTSGVRTGTEEVVRGGLDQLVRRNLRGVWVSGDVPSGPAVWAANHHSWWDFFVAAAAARAAGRDDIGVLMDATNVGRRALYDRAGVVGTDRLRTAVDMLRSGMMLVVFPEGRLWPAGGLRETAPGARWLAEKSGAALHAVATRVVLRAQQAPEAYLDISPPLPPPPVDGTWPTGGGGGNGPHATAARWTGAGAIDPLTAELSARLATVDDALATADPERPLPGFRAVVTGVRSWNERFARREEQ